MNLAELISYCDPLIGHQIQSVDNEEYWIFKFEENVDLITGSPWRLVTEDSILVTSSDHGQPFGLPKPVDAKAELLTHVHDRKIEAADISVSSGDLTLRFSDGIRLEILVMSSGYEAWRLHIYGALTYCDGGDIEHFPAS